ncbi:enoyl-CoA hydratase/isomerase family protein [Desulfosporosinus youngiae]|uniref:short-chain-enoyl-CoA hydratase n=1 Tax=Desulfosporosinus youngiae DSM 17734 TaxID=768710 RepID=H5XUX8_9FIRM|nr:enoyl-CoA hydratase-related protein [Desulfosporosinus youngiae]EHQ89430.1 enoyl-CoA hydratase/carnithine racemase [Desulfosporosinus youngiae DSM 17734]
MENQEYTSLLCEQEEGVAIVVINRAEVMNALNGQVFNELGRIFAELEADDTVQAVILTGSGKKAFAAGADISQMQKMTTLEGRKLALAVKAAQDKIASLSKPVIAAVNGFALGGGCEVAMCCDFRIAAENARFGQPEINLGIIPGGGGTQRLTNLVGLARAKDLVLTGRIIDAQEALNIGLVNKVVAAELLISEAKKLAYSLAEKSGFALNMAKVALNQSVSLDLESGLDYEIECFAACFSTYDQKEGMAAFAEKRKPKFMGR